MRSGLNGSDIDDAPLARISAQPLHVVVESVRLQLHMSAEEVRIAHWGCGGNARRHELSAFLAGDGDLSDGEYNTLAAAMNDKLIEISLEPSVPYRGD